MATRKHFPLPLGAVIDAPAKPATKTTSPRGSATRVSAGVDAARQAAGLTSKTPAPAQPKLAPAKTVAPAAVPTASGLGLDSARARAALVAKLVAFGIQDQMVLDAIGHVPRHQFIDPGLASQAYEDTALPIGHQQTISKPSVVARMIALMRAPLPPGAPLNRVLEIGTGCGYQAAVLSLVAKEVYTIERIKPLYEKAKANLRPLRVPNIRLLYGDGMLGAPTAAPFDAIVLAAAGLEVPPTLLEQLVVGGRLIAPVAQANGRQQLRMIERTAQHSFKQTDLEGVFFVPLKSGTV